MPRKTQEKSAPTTLRRSTRIKPRDETDKVPKVPKVRKSRAKNNVDKEEQPEASRGVKRKAEDEPNGDADDVVKPTEKKAKPASNVEAPSSKPASQAAAVFETAAEPPSKTSRAPSAKPTSSRVKPPRATGSRAGSESKVEHQPAASASGVNVDAPILEESEEGAEVVGGVEVAADEAA